MASFYERAYTLLAPPRLGVFRFILGGLTMDRSIHDYMSNLPIRELLVYTLVSMIPIGFVTTYGSISRVTGVNPRIVGRILASNPYPILIPCHRVVRSDGSLGGYSMGGPKVKRRILELEGVKFDPSGRVLKEHIIDMFGVIYSNYNGMNF
ncbi:MAG: MGMT family protein [Desulfurococcales archaeon]|nr:MGMT family protein [Desulfurococcales archaeon]